ncbi:NMDA receptor synaptonuclear signaling and neuronal migration factor-like [Littorina saxatilis]|uniref:NMDA receptor synaptonuclear signaling and neuronal migration factor-like n=1 Tax=Littorina saxatilis TaxID=31220 RepID=UPI0038B674D1
MNKAIRRGDNSIIYIVYDFDNCTFLDLLHICRQRLEQHRPGCKAASVLLMCTGAEGCIYMFRKIVLTPQKMRRVQYQDIKMFWRCLGELVSKASSEDSAIHLLGGSLNNTQGKTLLYETQKSLLPNLATVSWVEENTDHGRQVIDLYFDYRKFLLWRAKNDSTHLLDYTDITRSWSSLAEEAEDMDTS